eukprot:13654058-Ditylum_brightwellii.AAC.1
MPPLVHRQAASMGENDETMADVINFSEEFAKPNTSAVIDDENNIAAISTQAELLHWQYRLGHLPFGKIHLLCALGILSRRLMNVKPPKCT